MDILKRINIFVVPVLCARETLLKWREEGRIDFQRGPFEHLSALLGNDGHWFTPAQLETCRALAGPHGWTIYKMLIARLEK